MSFAMEVKEELCQFNITESHCAEAEFEAMLRFSSEIDLSPAATTINFSSSSIAIIRLFLKLLKRFYNCETELIQKQETRFNKHNVYIIKILTQVDVIIEEMNLLGSNALIKEEIIQKETCKAAYLRGAFIAKGSVNDPKTSNYHLEIIASNETEALFIQRLMNSYDLNGKICKRRDNLIVYIKDISAISDFLRIIGTQNAVFQLEDTIIKRGMASNINRIMNCEVANSQKSMNAAKEQMRYIKYLEYNYPLEKLDPKILMIMKVRKENQDASFQEMIEILESDYGELITKSGLNHRFRKIKDIAIQYQKDRKSNLK